MKIQGMILGAAIALAVAAPAQAQSVRLSDPFYSVGPPASNPVPMQYAPYINSFAPGGPTAKQLAAELGAENPGVTSDAKRVYEQLAAGRLDRAKLTGDVSGALPAASVQSTAQTLVSLGTPAWSFVGNAQSSAGDVSIYKLQFAKGVVYMTFGVDSNGIVYAFALGEKPLATL